MVTSAVHVEAAPGAFAPVGKLVAECVMGGQDWESFMLEAGGVDPTSTSVHQEPIPLFPQPLLGHNPIQLSSTMYWQCSSKVRE